MSSQARKMQKYWEKKKQQEDAGKDLVRQIAFIGTKEAGKIMFPALQKNSSSFEEFEQLACDFFDKHFVWSVSEDGRIYTSIVGRSMLDSDVYNPDRVLDASNGSMNKEKARETFKLTPHIKKITCQAWANKKRNQICILVQDKDNGIVSSLTVDIDEVVGTLEE